MNDIEQIQQIITETQKILIIQADNPDADSLGSALALEAILHDMGKDTYLYCGIDIPEYLKYLSGWDRVLNELPSQFDASIIVDTSAVALLQQIEDSGKRSWIAAKPVIVLDHHAGSANDIPYATVVVNQEDKVSTGEVIYGLAKQLGWPLPLDALEFITTSILADSMGLVTETTSPATYRAMAELLEKGVSRPKLEEQRRAFSKMPQKIFKYKADLIDHTEFYNDGTFALVVVPQNEISEFSPLYNPAPLIQNDHLQTENVLISIVIKTYDSGRITGAIRCNQGAPIAADLALGLGGGGHHYAAGFKLEDSKLDDVKPQILAKVTELLDSRA
jgi:bifunctional oligoribonuclease and PAP phosphatase NrnA